MKTIQTIKKTLQAFSNNSTSSNLKIPTPIIKAFLILKASILVTGCLATSPIKDQATSNEQAQPALNILENSNQNPSQEKEKTDSINLIATNSEHSDLWDRIRDSYDLDLDVTNKRIQAELNWYKRHQGYMDRMTNRASRYMYFIMEQIETRDLPAELALLPIVESAFDPFAYSHGRASGVWQFIPSTGRMYGLKQDWWYDGRRDIRLATIAALKFLEGLNREFKGDWQLALAAYNSGAGTVRKAIRYNKRKGRPTDFWSLRLPKETRAYVPKMWALAKIVKNPEAYGIKLKPLSNAPYFAVVDTGSQIDLSQAALLAETDLDEIYKLNPGYNQWATSPTGPHQLLVPVDKKTTFEANLAKLPIDQRIKWERYTIKSGDSLLSIAKKFRTTPDALKQANPIRGNRIIAGDKLLIPTSVKSGKHYSLSANNRLAKKQSYFRGSNGSKKISYQVKTGDSFWDLARKHGVGVRELARWNGMAPTDPLKPGQKLVIWSKNPNSAPTKRNIIRKVNYTVRTGDSLSRIASRFGVTTNKIKQWNNFYNKKYLQPGQKLTLYVDVTKAR